MFTIYRFVSEGALRSTIFDMIKRFESGKSAKHHSGGLRPDQKAEKELGRLVNYKDGVSQRKLASLFQYTLQYVLRLSRI